MTENPSIQAFPTISRESLQIKQSRLNAQLSLIKAAPLNQELQESLVTMLHILPKDIACISFSGVIPVDDAFDDWVYWDGRTQVVNTLLTNPSDPADRSFCLTVIRPDAQRDPFSTVRNSLYRTFNSQVPALCIAPYNSLPQYTGNVLGKEYYGTRNPYSIPMRDIHSIGLHQESKALSPWIQHLCDGSNLIYPNYDGTLITVPIVK